MIIAIDPGKAGGIAYESVNGIKALKMPATESDVVETLKHIRAEFDVVEKHGRGDRIVAYIEKVGGFIGHTQKAQSFQCRSCKRYNTYYIKEGNPGSAMFKFGYGAGVLIGALLGLKIPIEEPRPQTWQKGLSCGSSKSYSSKTEWKNHLKGMAQKKFPDIKVTLNTSDALLILSYAQKKELYTVR